MASPCRLLSTTAFNRQVGVGLGLLWTAVAASAAPDAFVNVVLSNGSYCPTCSPWKEDSAYAYLTFEQVRVGSAWAEVNAAAGTLRGYAAGSPNGTANAV